PFSAIPVLVDTRLIRQAKGSKTERAQFIVLLQKKSRGTTARRVFLANDYSLFTND
ncbi:unnamed protein product, partial [marine sediment metagenome]